MRGPAISERRRPGVSGAAVEERREAGGSGFPYNGFLRRLPSSSLLTQRPRRDAAEAGPTGRRQVMACCGEGDTNSGEEFQGSGREIQ